MINYLNSLKVRTKLSLLTGILLLGMGIFGYLSSVTLDKLSINGPYYQQIQESQELIADILPPPVYIIEAYLTAFQEAEALNSEERQALILRSRELQRQYEERYAYWENRLTNVTVKRVFKESYEPAIEFFNVWQKQFLPALQIGDKKKLTELLQGPMKDLYNLHRTKIDEVVRLGLQSNETITKALTDLGQRLQFFSKISWISTILIGILLASLISYSITNRLRGVLNKIGDVTHEIDSLMQTQNQLVSQQSTSIIQTTAAVEEINLSFKNTEALAQESSNHANNSLKVTEEGNKLIKKLVDGLIDHKEKVLAIVQHILRLSEITKQIHNIASATSNLTNQTNILALNAAVQAVNVKHQSESFSVIASEIRKLADESKKFLSHIDVLAENIKSATDSTIVIAQEGSQTVQEEIRLAHSSIEAFDAIRSITKVSFEGAEQVLQNIRQQSLATNQVLEAVESANLITHQTLEGMKRVHSEMDNLNKVSNELKTIV